MQAHLSIVEAIFFGSHKFGLCQIRGIRLNTCGLSALLSYSRHTIHAQLACAKPIQFQLLLNCFMYALFSIYFKHCGLVHTKRHAYIVDAIYCLRLKSAKMGDI